MSKLRILSHLGSGLYDVEVLPNTSWISAKAAIASAERRQILLNLLPAANALVVARRAVLDAAVSNENAVITQYNALLVPITAVTDAHTQVITTGSSYRLAQLEADILTARVTSIDVLIARIAQLQVIETRRTTAWACDASFGLIGAAIGGIDIDGDCEASGDVLIRPNLVGSSVYDAARDGKNTPAFSASPEALTYNWALRDGWQKWMPLYRIATITDISYAASTCSVTYRSSRTSDTDSDINDRTESHNVPVIYSTCGADAFRIGDDVVVYFPTRSWLAPTVIGFRNRPRKCGFRARFNDADTGNPIVAGPTDLLRFYEPSPSFSLREEILVDAAPFLSDTFQYIITPSDDYASVLVEARFFARIITAHPTSYLRATRLSGATAVTSGSAPITLNVQVFVVGFPISLGIARVVSSVGYTIEGVGYSDTTGEPFGYREHTITPIGNDACSRATIYAYQDFDTVITFAPNVCG